MLSFIVCMSPSSAARPAPTLRAACDLAEQQGVVNRRHHEVQEEDDASCRESHPQAGAEEQGQDGILSHV